MKSKVAIGGGKASQLAQILQRLGTQRVFVVAGKTSLQASGGGEILSSSTTGRDVSVWSDFSSNPSVEELSGALRVAKQFGPDVIIGIGGGTALDLAKAVAALLDAPLSHVKNLIVNGTEQLTREVSLVLLPTTSGSGSEATHFSVIYVDDIKFSLRGPALTADFVIVDWHLCLSNSRSQRATSGVDALTQAIESYWAQKSTRVSRRYSRRALKLITSSLSLFVAGNTDALAARNMALGSHLAGRAIDISQTTGAHALSYKITTAYKIPHGNAVALTLGAFMDLHSENFPDTTGRANRRRRNLITRIQKQLGFLKTRSNQVSMEFLLRDLGLVPNFVEAGISGPDAIRDLASSVNEERLANNPVRLGPSDIEKLLAKLTG